MNTKVETEVSVGQVYVSWTEGPSWISLEVVKVSEVGVIFKYLIAAGMPITAHNEYNEPLVDFTRMYALQEER